jgi:hypothetical protein
VRLTIQDSRISDGKGSSACISARCVIRSADHSHYEKLPLPSRSSPSVSMTLRPACLARRKLRVALQSRWATQVSANLKLDSLIQVERNRLCRENQRHDDGVVRRPRRQEIPLRWWSKASTTLETGIPCRVGILIQAHSPPPPGRR